MEKERNVILKRYGDFTFEQALDEVNILLKTEEEEEEKVQISIIKTTTRAGVKFVKDMVVEVSKKDAEDLISKKKAKYLDEA